MHEIATKWLHMGVSHDCLCPWLMMTMQMCVWISPLCNVWVCLTSVSSCHSDRLISYVIAHQVMEGLWHYWIWHLWRTKRLENTPAITTDDSDAEADAASFPTSGLRVLGLMEDLGVITDDFWVLTVGLTVDGFWVDLAWRLMRAMCFPSTACSIASEM